MRLIRIVAEDNGARADFAAALVEGFECNGLAVSVISRSRQALALDRPGKDSHAHRAAGARDVAVISAGRVAVIHEAPPVEPEPTLDELLARMQPVDIVLALGFDEARGDVLRLGEDYVEFGDARFPAADLGALFERLASAA